MLRAWFNQQGKTIKQMWPLLPAAAYLLGFLVIVCVYLIGLTFSVETSPGHFRFPSMHTVSIIIAGKQFSRALVRTTLFVLVGTPLELVSGFFLAIILYGSFRLRSFIRGLFLIPLALPALVTATMLFILFDFPGGHINHLLMGKYAVFPRLIPHPINWRGSPFFALGISLLGKVWRDAPISMLILLAGLNAIDPEILDAAKTMGAGLRRRIWHVILPLMVPSLSAVLLLRSIEMWKEFIFPFILAGKYGLLGTLIESLYNDWGNSNQAAAVALILVLCIVVSTLLILWVMEILKKNVLKA